jgi:hypothetical protein
MDKMRMKARTDLSDGNLRIMKPERQPNTQPMTIPTGPCSNCCVKLPVVNTIPRRTPNRKIATTSLQLVIAVVCT